MKEPAESMRILMLTDFYAPIIGGLERHVRDLGVELVGRGHQVSVATFKHGELPSFEIDHGIRVHRISGTAQRASWLFSQSGRRFAPPMPDPEAIRALWRIVKQERPDIVHAHNWLIHSFTPLKRWAAVPLVMTLHDYGLICAKKTLMHLQESCCTGPGFQKCLGCATEHYGAAKGIPTTLANWASGIVQRAAVDRFLPVSNAVATGARLADKGLPYTIVPNFVSTTVAEPRQHVGTVVDSLPNGDFVLFVGALGRHKGINVLLEAYDGLKGAPPLVLIGATTPETPERLPPNVVLLRDLPHFAVMEAWRRCLFGVVPSTWSDPCPTVALEAMSAGRALVASRIGGLTTILEDGVTGILVPPDEPTALRHAISALLSDRELSRKMGIAAKDRVIHFQADRVVGQIVDIYKGLIKARSRQSDDLAS